jgi:hypothetical protein
MLSVFMHFQTLPNRFQFSLSFQTFAKHFQEAFRHFLNVCIDTSATCARVPHLTLPPYVMMAHMIDRFEGFVQNWNLSMVTPAILSCTSTCYTGEWHTRRHLLHRRMSHGTRHTRQHVAVCFISEMTIRKSPLDNQGKWRSQLDSLQHLYLTNRYHQLLLLTVNHTLTTSYWHACMHTLVLQHVYKRHRHISRGIKAESIRERSARSSRRA